MAASRTIGSTMKASSSPPSVHIAAPNQPPGQRRPGVPAGLTCPLRQPAAVVPVPYLAAPGGARRPACQAPAAGHGVVRDRSEAGRLAWPLASAGEMTTNPLLLMMAWPCGLSTKLMNFWPSAASGALLGMVSP